MSDVGFDLTPNCGHAKVNVAMDTFEQKLSCAELDRILSAWQRAWAAVQSYKADKLG